MDIGNRVRALRKGVGLSQEEVARRAGVSLNIVHRLERGVVTDPHYSTLQGLAAALGMPVERLVAEEEAPAALAGKVSASIGGPGRIVLDDPVTHSDPDESVILDMGPGKEPVRATVQQLAAGWSLMMREDMSAEEAWRVVTNQSGMASS